MANKKIVPRGTITEVELGNGKTAYGTGVINGIPCITFEPLKESVEAGTFLPRDSDAYTGEKVILKLETIDAVYGLFRMLSRIMADYDKAELMAFREEMKNEAVDADNSESGSADSI